MDCISKAKRLCRTDPLQPVVASWIDGGGPEQVVPDDGCPALQHKEFPPPPKTIPRTGGAIDKIFNAIKKGSPLTNDFSSKSGQLTSPVKIICQTPACIQ